MPLCPACGRENPDDSRFCGSCGAPLVQAPPARDVRKTVTVVFCDVTGSTALGGQLDPESLRRVMARYFDEMQAVVERHEGTVEKFIGDAVMAVFGVPVLHEDDALRAVRAAAEMRDRLEALNQELERDWGTRIQVRTGVNTGEVVAGDARGRQRFATGDAVNVAKRFEEAAPAGEILLGEPTYRLVRDAVDVEESEPLELKGKSEPAGAYRLLSVEHDTPERARHLKSPMVGRDRERALLTQAYDRAVNDRACHLFTILGAAGVGKSRLVAEFLDGLGDQTSVLRGRCRPYGEGITFWPLLEIVRRLYGEDPVRAIAQELSRDKDARLIAERVGAAVGLAESGGAPEETLWAARKLFEGLARERPLIVVFDDIQWAEPTFLQLVEHIADLSRDAPILLLCIGRPELLDTHAGWGGGKFNATSVLLEPLDEQESVELLDNLLGHHELAAIRRRVAEAAEGNPLFVEEMLAMLIDDGVLEAVNGGWEASADLDAIAVPPTIQALLSARLERLGEPERAVIECASVEGKVFHRGAVAQLVGGPIEGCLHGLVRKELVRPDQSELPGEDAFRFRHLLIRDAAYESIPKEHRAELHAQFARWLEQAVGTRVAEYEELLGYHLEQAYRYRLELAPADEAAISLGNRAAERLSSAGQRALARDDAPATISLLDRALDLVPAESPNRVKLLSDLGLALSDHGELERASVVLAEAESAVRPLDEPGLQATVALRAAWVGQTTGTDPIVHTKQAVEETMGRLEELGDQAGFVEASFNLGILHMWTGHCAAAADIFDRTVSLARTIGQSRIASRAGSWLLLCAYWGALPVSDSLRLSTRVVDESGGNAYLEGFAEIIKGALYAMAGQWDECRTHSAAGHARLEDLGQDVNSAAARMPLATVQLMSGFVDEAEQELRLGYAVLDPMGEKGYLSTTSALLGLALVGQGRHDEAEQYVVAARELGAPDDHATQSYWRCAAAQVLASRQDFEGAETLSREALDLLEGTDMLPDLAQVLLSRFTVLTLAGDHERARTAIERAITLCKEKEFATGLARLEQLAAV